jgi:hypothetical protein
MMRKWYRKFKKKHRLVHVFLMGLSILMFWWGAWGILELYVTSYPLAWYALGILVAFLILYLDNFHLKELE